MPNEQSDPGTNHPTKPRIQAVLNRIDGGRVLHIGCGGHDEYRNPGPNWMHGQLARVATDLVGVDIDAKAVEAMQADGWQVSVDDAAELDSVDGQYDVVVAGEVIEHLSNPGEMFEAVRDVLTDDGRFIVTTPNPWAVCYIRRVVTGDDPVGNSEHCCWIDKTTLKELANRHGYDGQIRHLRPMAGGLSALAYRVGRKKLGGTRLIGEFGVVS